MRQASRSIGGKGCAGFFMLRHKNRALQQQGSQNRTHEIILFFIMAQGRKPGQIVRILRTQMTEKMQMKKIIHRRGFKALEGCLEPQALRRHTGKIAGGGLRLFVRISVIKDRKPA